MMVKGIQLFDDGIQLFYSRNFQIEISHNRKFSDRTLLTQGREIPVYLVGYAKRMLYSEHATVLLAWRHLSTMLLTNFENLTSILNIFQDTHDFLVLTDPAILCIYLRTADRQFL